MAILVFLPLVLLLAGGIDVVSSDNPFVVDVSDQNYKHISYIQQFCMDYTVTPADEKKLDEQKKKFDAAIKARHGKASKMTKTEIEKEEAEAKKKVDYSAVLPACCKQVKVNLKYNKDEKANRAAVKAYIEKADVQHKEGMMAHINNKVGKDKGKSEAPSHADGLILSCAAVTCTSTKLKIHCEAKQADVDAAMKKMHEAKQALVKNDKDLKTAKEKLSEHRNKDKSTGKKQAGSSK